jgi:hypothetical protein
MTIKFARNGKPLSDYPEEQVPALIQSGALRADDLYWQVGMTDWQPVSTHWGPEVQAAAAALNGGHPIKSIRLVGAALFAIGAVLGWLCIVQPLQEAAEHAESISVSLKGIFLVPTLFVAGILYLVIPRWTARTLGMPKERKPTAWFFIIPMIVLGGVVYWVVKTRIHSYGYRF